MVTPSDNLRALTDAADPLRKARELFNSPGFAEVRRQQELLNPKDGVIARALAANAAVRDQLTGVTGLSERYRSPFAEAIETLGRSGLNLGGNTAPALPAPHAPSAASVAPLGEPVRSTADIGARVRASRRAMGMTQQQFADIAGVGRRFLVELEKGKPSLEIGRVLAVCQAAGLTLVLAP